jgi:hypothetical protein
MAVTMKREILRDAACYPKYRPVLSLCKELVIYL